MLQVFDALFETAIRYGREYGPRVAVGVLAVVAAGVALRALSAILPRGGPERVKRRR
jgi:hypothetical protein